MHGLDKRPRPTTAMKHINRWIPPSYSLASLLAIILCCSWFPDPTTARPVRLTYINGIATHMEHMYMGEREISKLFQEKVDFVWNPTAQQHMEDFTGWLGDLAQAGTQKLGRITAEVDCLVEHLRAALHAVGPRGCVVHICHSQGALVTSLACQQLTPDEMTRIEILSFGGAVTIRKTPRTPFRRVMNYYSVNDPLLWVAPSAAQQLRSGRVVGLGAEDPEFCFLAPRLGDPIGDHDILGPTYSQALAWEGQRFQREHRSMGYKVLHPAYVMFLEMQLRLREVMKIILRAILKMCLANYQWTVEQIRAIEAWIHTWIWKPVLFICLVLVESIRSWRFFDSSSPRSTKVILESEISENQTEDTDNQQFKIDEAQNQSSTSSQASSSSDQSVSGDQKDNFVATCSTGVVVSATNNNAPEDAKSFMGWTIHKMFPKRQSQRTNSEDTAKSGS